MTKQNKPYVVVFFGIIAIFITTMFYWSIEKLKDHRQPKSYKGKVDVTVTAEKYPKYTTMKGIVRDFDTSQWPAGTVLVLSENGGMRAATPEEMEWLKDWWPEYVRDQKIIYLNPTIGTVKESSDSGCATQFGKVRGRKYWDSIHKEVTNQMNKR